MKRKKVTLLIIVVIFSIAPGLSRALAEEDFSRPQELVLQSEAVFKSFMADQSLEWFHENVNQAKGIFIVPRMLSGGFIIGGSGGSGALLAKNRESGTWSYPAFYTMGSVSFGLQIGAETSEILLLIMTDKGINAMLSNEFKLGGDVTLAAGPVGATAQAKTADVIAYGKSKGVFVGLKIQGAVIAPRHKWNNTYYGKEDVSLVDILINQTVNNPQADNLRNSMPATQ